MVDATIASRGGFFNRGLCYWPTVLYDQTRALLSPLPLASFPEPSASGPVIATLMTRETRRAC
jgi:hypothetical protein